jgi:Family of unknown function (DUF5675)
MRFTLEVIKRLPDGIFGTLTSDTGWQCVCLQHAYLQNDGTYTAKVSPGIYTCKLRDSAHFGYKVYGLVDVPAFQGKPVSDIEIHRGNYNKDSEGCILLGEDIITSNGQDMITKSEKTFDEFMELLGKSEEFTLHIT